MLQGARFDPGALDERVDVGLLEPDHPAELVGGELTLAVLIMALLGAGMWLAFRGIFDGATEKAGTAVNSIGG